MSNRHQRRSDLSRFRRGAPDALLTYLVEPSDPALTAAPLLRAAADHWLAALGTRCRHCLICSSWLVDGRHVGALLLSTSAIATPTSAAVAAVCVECWQADLPLDALDRAVEQTLRSVIPNGKLEPLIAPRCQAPL